MKLVLIILVLVSTSAFAVVSPQSFYATVGLVVQKQAFKTVCSGVLLAPDVVLTAAHCLQDTTSIRVINKSQISRLDYSGVRGKKYYGVSWQQHPDYNGIEVGSVDLGIIFLNRNLHQNLPYYKMSQSILDDIRVNDTFYRVGFGKRNNKNYREIVEMTFESIRRDFMVTNDTQGVGGDSGGPVFADINNELVLIGIHCGRLMEEGKLVDLSYLQVLTPLAQEWINSSIVSQRK